jgi:hypothetical protein
MELLAKLGQIENFQCDIKTSGINGQEGFVSMVSFGTYDPQNKLPNGGPVTLKGITLSFLGDSFESSQENALEGILTFMGEI